MKKQNFSKTMKNDIPTNLMKPKKLHNKSKNQKESLLNELEK